MEGVDALIGSFRKRWSDSDSVPKFGPVLIECFRVFEGVTPYRDSSLLSRGTGETESQREKMNNERCGENVSQ